MSKKSETGVMESYSATTSPSKNGSDSREKKALRMLFEDQLRGIYSAEKLMIEALPEMAKAADNEDLEGAFTDHLEQTKKQVTRLEKIFDRLHVREPETECQSMKAIIQEGKEVLSKYESGSVRDAALIINAQKVEHYEMAVYGSLREIAEVLGLYKIADQLDRSLAEETETDQMLTEIAADINEEAFYFERESIEMEA
jgi:ferritin-like metal-binding protein YciE